jgi:hypothetical protein
MNLSGLNISGAKLGGSALENYGNLILDWDAAALSNMTIENVSGTDRCKRWVDKKIGRVVGGGGTNTTWPVFNSNYHNGLPALTFDGVDDFLNGIRETQIQGINKLTMVLVSLNGCFGHISGLTAHRTILSSNPASDNVTGTVAAGSSALGTQSSVESGVSVKVMSYDGTQTGNANRLKLYRNKTPLTLTFTNTIPAATEVNTNSRLNFGFGNNSSTPFAGSIMRALMFLNDLDQASAEAVSDILNQTYNLY